MQKKKVHNPIYWLLIDSKFRLGRHIVLIISVGIIFLNHVYLVYKEQTETVNTLGITFDYILISLLIMYLNIYWLIP